MDASNAITILFLLLASVYLSYEMPSDPAINGTTTPAIPAIHETTTLASLAINATTLSTPGTVSPANCTNGWGMAGGCVVRTKCIFNTTNIDLTVFGPPGYRDPCPGDDLCCPTAYIQPVTKVAPDYSDYDSYSHEDD